MAAVNSVPGFLPLTEYLPNTCQLLMSAAMGAKGEVTLQIREGENIPDNTAAGFLARYTHDDGSIAIGYPDTEMLSGILGKFHTAGTGESETEGSTSFELLENCTDQELPAPLLGGSRSPEEAEACSSDSQTTPTTPPSDTTRLQTGKKPRPKAASPTRQGPQQCQVCSKIFGNASALAKHKLTHSDERKYVCTMCAKAFKRQDHLNGHMLTHRNKKPYECKADGCGKSYCDARSLRRHTENHHSTGHSRDSTHSGHSNRAENHQTSSTVTLSPATASGDASSPHGATCIQYASTGAIGSTTSSAGGKTTSGNAHTKSTPTTTADNSKNNDGLTRQQLELISQIMQQTKQQQSAEIATATATSTTNRPMNVRGSKSKPPRTWNMQTQLQQNQNKPATAAKSPVSQSSPGVTVNGTSVSTIQNGVAKQIEQKPVECNLCHRKFKNIPALNGHMRLHGGYFKKDNENKKCEKKEANMPPLTTASANVRSMIEEKILIKRGAGGLPPDTVTSTTNSISSSISATSATVSSTTNITKGFAVPATPPVLSRRNSESDPFLSPKAILTDSNNTVVSAKDATLIELLRRGTKVSVKRAVSDPGQGHVQLSLSGPGGDMFTLAYQGGVSASGYYSQEEIYHVQDTAMLLQAVDSIQLLHDTSAAEQLDDIASLEDYATVTASLQQEQQPTINSNVGTPTAVYTVTTSQDVSSTVGSTTVFNGTPVNQELQAVLDSPLPESLVEFGAYHSPSPKDVLGFQKEYVMYTNSPHSAITAPSPLPSPLRYHDSPGLGYPTPPASHETQSSQHSPSTNSHNNFMDDKGFSMDCDRQDADSPLSTTFFLSTSSSGVHHQHVNSGVTLNTQSADSTGNQGFVDLGDGNRESNSSLSGTFFDTNQNGNAQTYSLDDARQTSSPLSAAFYTTTMSSAEEVEEALETVLPGENIHDELDIYPQSPIITQLQLPYLPAILQSQMMPNSEDPLLSSSPKDFASRKKFDFCSYPVVYTLQDKRKLDVLQNPAPLNISVDNTKNENNTPSDVFLSPNSVSASPNRSRKRLRSDVTAPSKSDFKSRLRSSTNYYTPSPILNPSRIAPGLFSTIMSRNDATVFNDNNPSTVTNSVQNETFNIAGGQQAPRINIGDEFQLSIPEHPTREQCNEDRDPVYEHLLWDPGIIIRSSQKEAAMQRYLEFATCAATPAGGYTQEEALKVLLEWNGDIQAASLQLLQKNPKILNYKDRRSERWSAEEIEQFLKGLSKYDKDFYSIAKEIGTKSSHQCVAFYYLWKQLCNDYKTLYLGRTDILAASLNNEEVLSSGPDNRTHACEVPDCSASFSSRAALHGHTRIHCSGRTTTASPPVHGGSNGNDASDEYPCKICGKIFIKVKSRSAHMKSHRPADTELRRVAAESTSPTGVPLP